MNPLSILNNSGSTISGTAQAGATEATPLATPADGAIFKAALTSSLASLFLGKTTPTTSTDASTIKLDGALVQRIRDSLDRGTSLNDVIASLASSLAASVANALGIPLDAAKARLTQAFTAALAPTGSGPPQTNADRAATLAQRFRHVAELATRVTTEDPGHTIRSITGTSSDAAQAGATPAPQTDRIIRDAIAALAVPASSATPTSPSTASADLPVPVAPATANDGRTVALDPAQAIATGGDTPLGRILTRGFKANDPTETGPATGPMRTGDDTFVLPGDVKKSVPESGHSLDTPKALDPHGLRTTPTGPRSTVTDALEGFVQAFTAAVRREDGPRSTSVSDPRFPSSLPTDPKLFTGPVSTPLQAVPAFATPVVNDVSAIAPPAPAQTLSQPAHVDANAVVDQVLRGVNVRTSDGSSEVRLRLVPEHLGDITVKLVVTGGSVDASITTHSADAQNVLAGAQNQLAKSLADAGLKLQSFTVALSGGAFSGNRDQQSSSQSWTARSTRRIGSIDAFGTDETDDLGLLAVPSFGPPIYTAQTAAGFNYLV